MKTLTFLFSNGLFLLSLISFMLACQDESSEAHADNGDAAVSADTMVSETVDSQIADGMIQDMNVPMIRSVGFRTTELTYTAPDGPRTLPVYFWYPSSASEGTVPRYNGFLASEGAYTEVPVLADTTFPVLLFSHGKRGMGAATSAFMVEHFAKSGWLVVAWEHTGDTTFNADDIGLTYLHRPLDISAVLDFVFDSNADHGFADRVYPQIVLSGHSRGGYGSLAVAGARYDLESTTANCVQENTSEYCQAYRAYPESFTNGFLDDRVNGLILLASGDYARFNEGVSGVSIPVLQWTAGGDLNNPNEVDGDPIWSALAGQSFRFDIANGGHFTFTSICSVVGPLGVDNGCDPDNYPLADAHVLINEYSLQFANGFIRGVQSDQAALRNLTTESLNDQNVTFSQKSAQ